MTVLLTDEIKRFRELFEGYEHGGLRMSGRAVETVIAKINTLLAMAGELEEENSCRLWNTSIGEPLDPRVIGGNVVMFPTFDDQSKAGDSA